MAAAANMMELNENGGDVEILLLAEKFAPVHGSNITGAQQVSNTVHVLRNKLLDLLIIFSLFKWLYNSKQIHISEVGSFWSILHELFNSTPTSSVKIHKNIKVECSCSMFIPVDGIVPCAIYWAAMRQED